MTGMRYRLTPEQGHPVLGVLVPWLAVLAWASLIFYLSAQPDLSTGLGSWDMLARKTAHVGEYAVLTVLLWFAISRLGVRLGLALPSAFVLAVIYASSDEIHQHFIKGRDGNPRDVVIDSIGVTIASLAVVWLRSRNAGASGENSRQTV